MSSTTGRAPALPDLATIAESGIPDFDVSPWFGVLAPARTPESLVNRLQHEILKVLQTASIRDRLVRDGVEPVGNTPQEFAAFIRGEMRKWAQAVRDSGAKVE